MVASSTEERSNDLGIIGGSHSHDVLREVLAAAPPGKVLDAPCGTGVLADFLRERGWQVTCVDIDPGNFQARDLPFARADLNRDALPFPDASFDRVVCANGLHRLFNPAQVIKEFHRVLRDGGTLHVTLPNYGSIQHRLRFLFYGSVVSSINRQRFEQTIDAPEARVRHHLFLPQLANLFEGAGFRISRMRATDVRTIHLLLWPLGLCARLASLLIRPRTRHRNRIEVANAGPV
ncbi:MAG: hypothetical protein A3J79_03420, partial [Elusimicrobia bacterium RIFOXYB2_FULL_62_6]